MQGKTYSETPHDSFADGLVVRLSALAMLTCVGCAPTLSTLQPARLTPAGHFAATTGVEVSQVHGDLNQVIGHARALRMDSGVTSEDLSLLANGANALFAHTPGYSTQLLATYGMSRDLELGLRATPTGIRIGLRWQFLRLKPGIYGSFGLGASSYLQGFPVASFNSGSHLDSYHREEIDAPLMFGISTRYFHLWAGPKVMYANYHADLTSCFDPAEGCVQQTSMNISGHGLYIAGQAGVAIGYRQVWVMAEISYARLFAAGHVNMANESIHAGYSVSTAATIIVPSVGLLVWF